MTSLKQDTIQKLTPSLLALMISSILVGCSSSGGSPNSGGTTLPPIGGGSIGNGTGGESGNGAGVSGGSDTNTGGGIPAQPQYEYKPEHFHPEEPDTSANKVKVGVIDSGTRNNARLDHALEKVYSYDEDYQTGSYTVQDLTKARLDQQDISSSHHGTLVSEVIAGKIPAAQSSQYQGMREGLAVDIA